MSHSLFYDDIAQYYDLIYADWEASMRRQGRAISEMLRIRGRGAPVEACRVLDVAAGVGTQALPLAALGYEVVARDLSPGAVARLSREARERGLSVDAAPADMRRVRDSVEGRFDAVIAFDNSIPHLQRDDEIATVFRGLSELLVPGGVLLISVRDYDEVDRSAASSHPYGERSRNGRHFRLGQEWTWVDASHYRTTLIVEESVDGRWTELVRTETGYYAVSILRLLELMEEAGLEAHRLPDVSFFQPVLCGRVP